MKAVVLQETRGIYPFVLVFIHLSASISAVSAGILGSANIDGRGVFDVYL